MLKKLRKFLFERRAKKYLELNPRERRFVTYDKARTVLILFESEFSEKNLYIRRMISNLQQDGKKVSAWGYIDKKEVTTAILPEFRVLHHKQTDFFQSPQLSFINELAEQEFDLLIDLTLKPLLPLQYVALYAKASCKIGTHQSDLELYDFVLNVESQKSSGEATDNSESNDILIDEIYLYDQIIFYIKSIQTKD